MLKELWRKSKAWAVPALAATFLVTTLYVGWQNIRIGDENSRLKGQHQVLSSEANHHKSQYAKLRTTSKANEDAANERIEELVRTEIGHLRIIERLEAHSATLEEHEPVFPEMESHPLVLSLRSQLRAKDVTIIELKNVINTQDHIILEVNGKVRIQRDLRIFAEAGWAKEIQAHDACKALAKGLEATVKKQAFMSGVKNVAIVTVAGVVTYLLIAK